MLSTLFAQTYNYSYQTTTTSSVSAGTIMAIYGVALVVGVFLFIIPLWKIFNKCGKPGWAAIVPIYNVWVLFEIVGYPGWWSLLGLIPLVNIFPFIMELVAYFKLAKLFGKGTGFAVCTILFPYVCIPILGYGSAQPTNTAGSAGAPPSVPNPTATPPQSPVPPTPPVTPTTPPAGGPVAG